MAMPAEDAQVPQNAEPRFFLSRTSSSMRKPLYPIEKDAEPATVCVTGGTGYIAGATIARLLAAGHTVHATVRDPSNEQKLRWLKRLPHADTHLKFFKVALFWRLHLCLHLHPCEPVCMLVLSYQESNMRPLDWKGSAVCSMVMESKSMLPLV